MKTVVMGAGVIGVTTAWCLARAGHEVVVIERQSGPARETSFANGGQIAVGHASPWARPDTLGLMLRSLGQADGSVYFRLKMDPRLWSWGLRFLRHCTTARLHQGRKTLHRLGAYSRDCLADVRAQTGINYHHQDQGILSLYRSESEFDHARQDAQNYTGDGPGFDILEPDAILKLEPSLAATTIPLAGGLLSKGDESGDAHLFTERLAADCQNIGVQFRYNCHVSGFDVEGSKLSAIQICPGRDEQDIADRDTEHLAADAFVMALGSYSPLLARELGLKIPVYPVKGYSATVNIDTPSAAPALSLSDEENRVVVTPMGDKLRAAGTAKIAGYDTTLSVARSRNTLRILQELCPNAGDGNKAEFWTGLRPMTPDGPPVLGQAGPDNLYLNTGHGTLGWTQACGSAQIIADLISGAECKISLDGLTMLRYL